MFPHIKLAKPATAPFPCMEYDTSKLTASRFLDALRSNPDDAWAFVSKVCAAGLNLHQLRESISADTWHVNLVTYTKKKNCITRSVYDKSHKMLLHLHMIKEPGGNWKIFGVDQEECRLR